MRAIALAHFEANLKGSRDASAFLGDDLRGAFDERGIDLEVGDLYETAVA
jgi:hypothetical protein